MSQRKERQMKQWQNLYTQRFFLPNDHDGVFGSALCCTCDPQDILHLLRSVSIRSFSVLLQAGRVLDKIRVLNHGPLVPIAFVYGVIAGVGGGHVVIIKFCAKAFFSDF